MALSQKLKLNKLRLEREKRYCQDCDKATEHYKVVLKLAAVSKVMAYSGAFIIPLTLGSVNKRAKWRCMKCDPLTAQGVDWTGKKGPKLSEQDVQQLLETGEVRS